MTNTADQFRRTLEDGVENEITGIADEIARTVVTSLWNSVDDQIGAYRAHARDADQHRDFYQRSAEHIRAKRDLAETVLDQWESGHLLADDALRMIRAALAVGDVQTLDQLRAAATPAAAAGEDTAGGRP
ncbi:hypothetical protein [Streptomyces sp. SID4982]|uniref:hypothetical protein n=1 Tax=Streptomyces sp. SID4982 TaxID=2690291 RepID=UPI001368DFAB|nr:hypothetical protein [Streptomyces sp. SID4982]MYS16593.1 hypothetical protein [Streptomyces sp. SID4982]